MSRNEKMNFLIAGIFLILFVYFLYIKDFLYALGWLILSATLFLGVYIPRKTDNKNILIIINVILPIIALTIFLYVLIYQ